MGVEVLMLDLVQSQEALGKLLAQKLPMKAAYRLGRSHSKIVSELREYEKQRVELFKRFVPDSKDGEVATIPADKIPEFTVELEELLSEKVILDIHQVPLDMLEGADLTVEDVTVLHFLFLDPDIEDKKE